MPQGRDRRGLGEEHEKVTVAEYVGEADHGWY